MKTWTHAITARAFSRNPRFILGAVATDIAFGIYLLSGDRRWLKLHDASHAPLIALMLLSVTHRTSWHPFSLGWMSHIVTDALTHYEDQGIKLAWPLTERRFRGPMNHHHPGFTATEVIIVILLLAEGRTARHDCPDVR